MIVSRYLFFFRDEEELFLKSEDEDSEEEEENEEDSNMVGLLQIYLGMMFSQFSLHFLVSRLEDAGQVLSILTLPR